jgi:hypothetical protein
MVGFTEARFDPFTSHPAMSLADLPMSAADVLQAFRHDAPNLFLGAAFVTVGLLAIGFSALRRTRDPLLIYFGIFAGLYGLRLWVKASILDLVVPHSIFYTRFSVAIDYLVPIPFVLYFRSADLLLGWAGILAGYGLAIVDGALAVATFAFAPRPVYDRINRIGVIAALVVLIVQFIRNPDGKPEISSLSGAGF